MEFCVWINVNFSCQVWDPYMVAVLSSGAIVVNHVPRNTQCLSAILTYLFEKQGLLSARLPDQNVIHLILCNEG